MFVHAFIDEDGRDREEVLVIEMNGWRERKRKRKRKILNVSSGQCSCKK